MVHPPLQEIITDSELEDEPGLSVPQRKAEPSMKPDNREEVHDVGGIAFHPLAHCLRRRNASAPIKKQRPRRRTRKLARPPRHPPRLRIWGRNASFHLNLEHRSATALSSIPVFLNTSNRVTRLRRAPIRRRSCLLHRAG